MVFHTFDIEGLQNGGTKGNIHASVRCIHSKADDISVRQVIEDVFDIQASVVCSINLTVCRIRLGMDMKILKRESIDKERSVDQVS